MENLKILIAGRPGSGKARMLYLLKKFLKENGFQVNHVVNEDFRSEESFDKHMGGNYFEQVVSGIKERTIITLEEVHVGNPCILEVKKCSHEGCAEPATCGGKCGRHCDCLV